MVQFRLGDAGAHEVALVGDFNGWHPEHRLHQVQPGVWAVDVALEPGVYNYVFVVDGTTWRLDPLANAGDRRLRRREQPRRRAHARGALVSAAARGIAMLGLGTAVLAMAVPRSASAQEWRASARLGRVTYEGAPAGASAGSSAVLGLGRLAPAALAGPLGRDSAQRRSILGRAGRLAALRRPGHIRPAAGRLRQRIHPAGARDRERRAGAFAGAAALSVADARADPHRPVGTRRGRRADGGRLRELAGRSARDAGRRGRATEPARRRAAGAGPPHRRRARVRAPGTAAGAAGPDACLAGSQHHARLRRRRAPVRAGRAAALGVGGALGRRRTRPHGVDRRRSRRGGPGARAAAGRPRQRLRSALPLGQPDVGVGRPEHPAGRPPRVCRAGRSAGPRRPRHHRAPPARRARARPPSPATSPAGSRCRCSARARAGSTRPELAPGVYHYAFVAEDGTWFVPESVPGRQDDGMGGHTAVLVVS